MGANCRLPSSIGSTLLSLPAAMGEPHAAFRVCTHTYTCVLTFLAAVGMSGKPDRPSSRHTGGSPQPSGKNHAQSSPNLLLCSCLFVSCLVWPELSAGLPAIDECEPRECGGVHNISYPFWIEGRQPPQCGYPAFKLSCQVDAPFIKISGKEYTVAGIFYKNQSFMVGSDELSKSNCPVPSHNLSLDATPFYLNPLDRNLSFFSGCSGQEPGYRIDCAAGGDGDRYVVGNPSSSDREEATKNCGSYVSWPYLGDGGAEGDEKYAVLLKRGFVLNWNAVVNCSVCTESGGRCRYDLSRESFSCNCSDRPHAVSCNGSIPLPGASQNPRGTSKTRKIAIAVGAGVGGFLLACALCFLVYRRKRMRARTGSSTLLFRTASSEPPSHKDPETGSTHYYPTHVFKYDELCEATDGFSEANELGDGGFGTVYKGKLRDGRIVAVKRLYESNYKRVEQFMNEVAILHRLQHPNLVTLYGCTSRHSRELLLVYEYVPNGTVADHLHGEDRAAEEGGSPPLGWPIRLGIAVETATALAYLHKVDPPIIHRDVKTNNILLDDNFHVKVADFGLSRLFPADATHVSTAPQGTPGYVDPEYHQCYQLTDKSDVYSFGVVLVELISSKPAVDITRHRHEINLATMAINKIQTGALRELVDPALDFDTDWAARRMIRLVAELAFRCLQAEKEMRPTMEDVAEVLRGIRDCRDDDDAAAAAAAAGGDTADQAVRDDASLLKNKNAPFSPDSVMDKWTSRTTTPNTSA